MRKLYLLIVLLPVILLASHHKQSAAQSFQIVTLTSSRALGGASIQVPPTVTSVRITVRVPGNLITGSGTTGNCGSGDNRVDLRLCPPNAGCSGVTVQAGQGQGLNICHQFEETLGPFTILNPRIPCTSLSFNAITEQVSTAMIELFGQSCSSSVQPFRQTDPEWASEAYDSCPGSCETSPGNIGQVGCGLTALAMALRNAGIDRLPAPSGGGTVPLTPGTLNAFLKTAGGGAGYNGPIVDWVTATALVNTAWSGITGQTTAFRFSATGFNSTSASDLQQRLCSGEKGGPVPVILQVAGPAGKNCAAGGCKGHFVVATGFRPDGRINVMDPADGQSHALDTCDPSQGDYGPWAGHSSHWFLRGSVTDPDDLSALIISVTGDATLQLVAGGGSKNKHVDELGDDFGTAGEAPLTVLTVEQPPTGHFELQVIGTGSGPYHLTVRAVAADGSVQPQVSFDGLAQSGQAQDFGIDFSSEPGSEIRLIPADAAPPVLAVTATPATLLQATDELATVTVAVQVSDDTDPAPVIRLESITCDDACEPANDISGATLNSDDRQFLLRAKRSNSGPGRVYTIEYSATDLSGKVTRATTLVRVPQTLFLHGSAAPPLFLDGRIPIDADARYADSAAVKFASGNPWKLVGSWTAVPSLTNASLDRPGSLDVWLGLKNSDDQGTRFDLRAEVYRNETLVTSREIYCVTGLTRNPSAAQQATFSLPSALGVAFNGTSDGLTLRILTRIGTNGSGGFCGGHSNAVGLRLYFDGANHASRLQLPF